MVNSFFKKKKFVSNWYLFDAKDKILGRLSTKVVFYLSGKNKFEYYPYLNIGDYVIIINSDKILVTGNKFKKKKYHYHSGYIGGIKSFTFEDMLIKDSRRIIRQSIKGMLPKNRLARLMLKRLKIYSNNYHIHNVHKPVLVDI